MICGEVWLVGSEIILPKKATQPNRIIKKNISLFVEIKAQRPDLWGLKAKYL